MATTIFGDFPITDLSYTGVQYSFASAAASNAFVYPPTILTFGSETLTRGSGDYIVYGDVRDISMSATAGVPLPADQLWDLNIVRGYTFNMGADILSFGNGNNTLYGDMRDLSLTVVGGTSTSTSLTQAVIGYNTFNFGIDTITAGKGNNTVYGDARDFSFSASGGSDPYGLQDTSVTDGGTFNTIHDEVFNFAQDTITLGNGNNVVYGDMRDLNVSVVAGTAVPQGIRNFTVIEANNFETINLASNIITVGDGNNTIYGNFRDWTFYGNGGTINGPSAPLNLTDTNGVPLGTSTVTSANSNPGGTNNIIDIGNGNNTIYANGENLSIILDGGLLNGGDQTFGLSQNDKVTLGNDVISAAQGHTDNGNNIVYGDLMDMTLSVTGGEDVDGYVAASAQIRRDTFTMGNDTISLGNGNNTVYGDMNDVNWTAQGGLNSVNHDFGIDGYVALLGDHLIMGNDTISVGNGNNTIYGDAHNVNLEGIGGTGDIFNSPGELSFSSTNGGSDTILFGNDLITAGKGNNLIAGDAWDINLEAEGGTASNGHYAWGKVYAVDLHFGNDTITVGTGNNTVYGDLHSFTMEALGGTVDSSGGMAEGQVTNNTVEFGSNNLTATSRNDTLYANVEYLNFISQNGTNNAGLNGDANAMMTGNSITFGNSTLVGGSGNNVFYGDAEVVTGLDQYLASGNTVAWSTHNVYTGGSGTNAFHFTLFNEGGLVTEGNTEITNFGAGHNDKLVFDAPAGVTYASLNAAITETYVGANTVLSFYDGSHITVDNVHLAAALSAANTIIVH